MGECDKGDSQVPTTAVDMLVIAQTCYCKMRCVFIVMAHPLGPRLMSWQVVHLASSMHLLFAGSL